MRSFSRLSVNTRGHGGEQNGPLLELSTCPPGKHTHLFHSRDTPVRPVIEVPIHLMEDAPPPQVTHESVRGEGSLRLRHLWAALRKLRYEVAGARELGLFVFVFWTLYTEIIIHLEEDYKTCTESPPSPSPSFS